MKLEHIKSYYIINGLCLFIVCVILTVGLPLAHEENVTDAREMTESDGIVVMENRKFTNTALPVFSGAEGWYQHIHIVQAIVKSNGWPDETAALQLFIHLKKKH